VRRWTWLVVFGLAVTACGGDSATDIVAPGDVSVTLSLAPGSLPEGVSADEVQLAVLVDETAEPGAPMLAIQLLPNGLVLDEPATLTVALPEAALAGGFMAIHMSGDSVEFLNGDIEQVDGVLSFRTSVQHFSSLTFHDLGEVLFATSLSVTPEQVTVGQEHVATATVTANVVPMSIWLPFESDPEGTFRLLKFSAPQPPIRFEDPEIVHGDNVLEWEPHRSLVDLTETLAGIGIWESDEDASSTCLKPNSASATFLSDVHATVTLLDRGAAEERDLIGSVARLLVDEPVERSLDAIGPVKLLQASPGDVFDVTMFLVSSAPSRCTGSTAITTTTSTTTTVVAPPPTTSDDGGSSESGGQSTEVGSAAGSTECPDPEADADQVGDGRAHPEFVRAYIDGLTQELYFHMFMCAAYGQLPPDQLFSFFWLLLNSVNPTTEVGWELHDGTVTILGTMSEAYILDDGSLLVATGLTPTGDYTITIDASYGSWVTEDGAPPVFGNTQFSIPAADVVLGDPFEEAGAEPVYDLVAGE